MDFSGIHRIAKAPSWCDCRGRRRVRDGLDPEIEESGCDVFLARLGEGCGTEELPRLSE